MCLYMCVCVFVAEYRAVRPVFGRSLESHLKQTEREVSMVIEECVGVLYQEALDEEVNCSDMLSVTYTLFHIKCSTHSIGLSRV